MVKCLLHALTGFPNDLNRTIPIVACFGDAAKD